MLAALVVAASAGPKAPEMLQLTGDTIQVHDPVIAKEGNTYYVFCTGRVPGGGGIIPIRCSTDLRN